MRGTEGEDKMNKSEGEKIRGKTEERNREEN